MSEYYARYSYYQSLYLSQYWLTAAGMTVIGAVLTPWMIGRVGILPKHPFTVHFVVAWVGLLLIWIAGDVGTRAGIWDTGVISAEADVLFVLFQITSLPALLSGVLALARRRLLVGTRFDSAAV